LQTRICGKLLVKILLALLPLGILDLFAHAYPETTQQIEFSKYAVTLIPPPQPAGSDFSRVFSGWGIDLSTESGSPVSSGIRTVRPYEQPPVDSPAILSGSVGTDAGALVIRFRTPVLRFTVLLGAQEATEATIAFFDASGSQLGEEVRSLNALYAWFSEDSFEDAEGREISRVKVTYENPDEPEALFMLRADFVDPPEFRTCVAQVGHGPLLGADQILQTQLSVTSSAVEAPFARTPDAQIRLDLLDQIGGLSTIEFDQNETAPLEFGIVGARSKILSTSGSLSEPARAYACVTSNYPVELAAVYRILNSGSHPVAEAGIQGAPPGYRFFGLFQKVRAEGTGTALALANVSGETATITIRLVLPLGLPWRELELSLEPGEQRAAFLEEFIPELSGQDTQGTVEIVSDHAIIATSLRTIDGVVSSSLSLGRSYTAE
jgi:hypothetical protein